MRTNQLLFWGFLCFCIGSISSAVADNTRRLPRQMHYQSFVSKLTQSGGAVFTVALFTETASCEARPDDRLASCEDPAAEWLVRFDGGCQEVTGNGACGLMPHVEKFWAEGGVIFEIVCGESGPAFFESLLVRVPEGSRCALAQDGNIECRSLAESSALFVRASCASGCPAGLGEGVRCSRCTGLNCPD